MTEIVNGTKMIIKVNACKCEKCGHVWLPHIRNSRPIACAKCKSVYWNNSERHIQIDIDKEFLEKHTTKLIMKHKDMFDKLAKV
jgi:hypothetical protein